MPVKLEWTWEEWQAGRAARRGLAVRVCAGPIRRKESPKDKYLKKLFNGERGPAFSPPVCEEEINSGEN